MKGKMVEYRIDPSNPPRPDKARTAELKALAAMDDADIDLSDIPEKSDWSGATRGRFYRPIKQSTTVRIDADVLHWLKAKGKGYQTRLNAILRAAMERDAA